MQRDRRQTSIDILPELYPYRDDGCEVSPSCLCCPLPICKYDDPGWLLREQRQKRDREVLTLKQQTGKSVPQLAHHFRLSQRTVHRILHRAANGKGS
ncbi:MAG: hypothetical protein HY676_04880 [Chloroflexi bacterium]|nr:hypothetical protein [Chloroflexota bacterium]